MAPGVRSDVNVASGHFECHCKFAQLGIGCGIEDDEDRFVPTGLALLGECEFLAPPALARRGDRDPELEFTCICAPQAFDLSSTRAGAASHRTSLRRHRGPPDGVCDDRFEKVASLLTRPVVDVEHPLAPEEQRCERRGRKEPVLEEAAWSHLVDGADGLCGEDLAV